MLLIRVVNYYFDGQSLISDQVAGRNMTNNYVADQPVINDYVADEGD